LEQNPCNRSINKCVPTQSTTFLGVPLVSFALLLGLSWLRFAELPIPITGGTIFFAAVFLYYLFLDWRVALVQAPVTLLLLWGADKVSQWPVLDSVTVFAATFIGGWIIQLAGHAIEGKRPALADNILQIFNAPLFLTVEVMLALGLRKELRPYLHASTATSPADNDGGTHTGPESA
jgi:uncharacterized membrane protein YGL010W